MIHKGTAAEQAAFFSHPGPWSYGPRREDLALPSNDEIDRRLDHEEHVPLKPMDVTPISSQPERVRGVGAAD